MYTLHLLCVWFVLEHVDDHTLTTKPEVDNRPNCMPERIQRTDARGLLHRDALY